MPVVLLKLTYYSQIMLKFFFAHKQKHPFCNRKDGWTSEMNVKALAQVGIWMEASLLFSLV